MKIFSAEQIKYLDKETVDNQYISSFKLMERAATKIVEALSERHKLYHNNFVILCGKGNNGGDGLAIARLLKEAGAFVKVYLWQTKKYSPDNSQNQEMLEELGVKVEKFLPTKHKIALKSTDIIVDALFGVGLTEKLDEEWGMFLNEINSVSCMDRIAIDIPSGLMSDVKIADNAPVFKANIVYTIQAPKLALLLPQIKEIASDFRVVDINLDAEAIDKIDTTHYYIDKEYVQAKLIHPNKFSHKGQFGHALIVGGSYGKIGSVVLASKAVLKVGAGLSTAYLPKCGYTILQTAVPEVMCETDNNDEIISAFPNTVGYKAIGIGIGLGQHKDTQAAFKNFLSKKEEIALVLDADALNLLALDKDLLSLLPSNTILTPHPKELERLIGTWQDDFDKMEKVKEISKKLNIIFVVKGAHSEVVLPSGDIYFNSTGNWGMATAGSGDVLTGILVGLLAQGYSADKAAIMGVYLHGLSGDIASESINPHSIMASNLIDYLNLAYHSLNN